MHFLLRNSVPILYVINVKIEKADPVCSFFSEFGPNIVSLLSRLNRRI